MGDMPSCGRPILNCFFFSSLANILPCLEPPSWEVHPSLTNRWLDGYGCWCCVYTVLLEKEGSPSDFTCHTGWKNFSFDFLSCFFLSRSLVFFFLILILYRRRDQCFVRVPFAQDTTCTAWTWLECWTAGQYAYRRLCSSDQYMVVMWCIFLMPCLASQIRDLPAASLLLIYLDTREKVMKSLMTSQASLAFSFYR